MLHPRRIHESVLADGGLTVPYEISPLRKFLDAKLFVTDVDHTSKSHCAHPSDEHTTEDNYKNRNSRFLWLHSLGVSKERNQGQELSNLDVLPLALLRKTLPA